MAIYVSHHIMKQVVAGTPTYEVVVHYVDDQRQQDYRLRLIGASALAVVQAATQAAAETAAMAGVSAALTEALQQQYPAEYAAALVQNAKAQAADAMRASDDEVKRRIDAVVAREQQSAQDLAIVEAARVAKQAELDRLIAAINALTPQGTP